MTTLATDLGWTAPVQARLAPFAPIELATDLSGLLSRLQGELGRANWLDAYLLAAGIQQVLDDRCSPSRQLVRRAASHFAGGPNSITSAAAGVIRRVDQAVSKGDWDPARYCGRSPLRPQLNALVHDLANLVITGDTSAGSSSGRPHEHAHMLVEALSATSSAMDDVLRLPSCFHSFDQRPADIVQQAQEFSLRFTQRTLPLAVIGVRTSGSYLAPLCAAALDQLGYEDLSVFSVRPGWPLSRADRAELARIGAANGLVLLLDDPPTTGNSIANVVEDLERQASVSPDRFVLLLACFGDHVTLPDSLRHTALIELPESEWACQDQFTAQAVQEALTTIVGDTYTIDRVDALGEISSPARGHFHRRFRVQMTELDQGLTRIEPIVAEGAGLGYFGRHALGLCAAAPELFSPAIGFSEGILYRRFLPEPARLNGGALTANGAPLIAAHILARQEALPAETDRSGALGGRQPVWEIASRIVAKTLGPLEFASRPLLVEPLIRRILDTSTPSIISGPTATTGWFLRDERHPTVKVDPSEGAFGHLDLASYDAVFDLAGAAVGANNPAFARKVRSNYELQGKTTIDPERWMLLQLVHIWNERRLQRVESLEATRRQARVFQTYVADRYLADLGEGGAGSYCALDLDGVLETSTLGFAATTHAGALALRALCAHGYRVLIASGRSLEEVADRCAAFGLPGGVAEYGSVIYDYEHKTYEDLLSLEAIESVAKFRSFVALDDRLIVDPAYQRCIRVFKRDATGIRRGLDESMAQALLADSGLENCLTAIVGEDQTDFVAAGVSKGEALRALIAKLDGAPCDDPVTSRPLALAVGDSLADASMLALARVAVVPANGDPSLGRANHLWVNRSYQAGAADAVAHLLGHFPGGCARCRMPALGRDARGLISLLSVQENGMRGVPTRLVRLAARESARSAPS